MTSNKYSVKILVVIAAIFTALFSACKKEYNSSLNCKLIEVTQLINNLSITWRYTYDSENRLSSCISPGSAPYYHNYTYTTSVKEVNTIENVPGNPVTDTTKFFLNLKGIVFYSSEEYSYSTNNPQPMTSNFKYETYYADSNGFLTRVKNDLVQTIYFPTDTDYWYTTHTITRTILNENCTFQIDSFFIGNDQNDVHFVSLTTVKYEYTNKLNAQNIDFGLNNLSPKSGGMGSGYNSKIFGKKNKNLMSKRIYTDSYGDVSVMNFQYEFNQYNYISKQIVSDSTETFSYVFKYDCGY